MTVEFGFRSKKFDFFRYFFPGNMRNISVSVLLTKIIGIQSNVFRYSIVFFFATWQNILTHDKLCSSTTNITRIKLISFHSTILTIHTIHTFVRFFVIQIFPIDGFHVTYCFDLYVRRPNFLEAKNSNRQWENLKNLSRNKSLNFSLLYYTVQKILALFN